ncbi:MAG: hypothetical protein BAJALOKI2v1_520015 [Promethearchaeota archaeon]|nr:MAG: hypothetical protein BAJALOKI2v1_520015 [Candidatus Lokiarchaeota archaeon]
MVKINDIEIGYILEDEFDDLDRTMIKKYAKASGDTNPIHTNDQIAEKAGLNGVIAHGLLSFGFITKMFENFLNHGADGTLIEVEGEMRGMVRPGDTLITRAEVSKIEDNKVFFDITQKTITKIGIKDETGKVIKEFEAAERGWISAKDRKEDLVHEKPVDEGTLIYREQEVLPGHVIIELNE